MYLQIKFGVLLAAAISLGAQAATDADGYNAATIRLSDVPQNAPAFSSYPASLYQGRNAELRLGQDPEAKRYKTRLQEWSKEKVNFAGHYILTTWGCGTSCVQIMIIDAKNGQVFHPKGVSINSAVNVQDELLDSNARWPGRGSLHFQPDSELLMLVGAPEEDEARRGISYFVWHNSRLELVRHIAKLNTLP